MSDRQSMTKTGSSHMLRVLSYVPMLLLIGWGAYDKFRPRGLPCPGMACIGQGLGEAYLFLFALIAAIPIGALLNIASYRLQGSPRSTLRKIELWLLFVTPLALVAAIAILIIV